jgi:hypothetical protein
MRAPAGRIFAPPFPADARWLNVATLRMDKQIGRPVLIEFFDVCRVASMRTLPYTQAWQARYAEHGLRVISVHTPGYEISRDEDTVVAAVARLGIEHAVLLDTDSAMWQLYGNEGWPARYLWDVHGTLADLHYGEGAYADAEAVIQELLGIEEELMAPLRPEDDPLAMVAVPTPEQPGAYRGPYEAGGVWVVASGRGTLSVDGAEHEIAYDGAHELIRHDGHTQAALTLEPGDGVTVHATVFTPGVVSDPAP